MRYVVKLQKIIEKIAVVEADSDEEADKKLMNGEVECTFEHVKNQGYYQGWEYRSHDVVVTGDLICNTHDLLEYMGCNSEAQLERILYKYTDCGIAAAIHDDGIGVTGYIEGFDGYMPNEYLKYPFTGKHFDEIVAKLDEQACDIWDEIHAEDDNDDLV